MFIYQIGRCIKGVPKAATTPKETTKQFFEDVFSWALSDGFRSYFCLLNCAKEEFSDINDFRKYWEQIRDGVFKQTRELFSCNDLRREEYGVVEKGIGTDRAECSVSFKIDVQREEAAVGGVKRKRLGYVYLKTDVILGKVGNRWYLTSGKWTGRFCGTSPE